MKARVAVHSGLGRPAGGGGQPGPHATAVTGGYKPLHVAASGFCVKRLGMWGGWAGVGEGRGAYAAGVARACQPASRRARCGGGAHARDRGMKGGAWAGGRRRRQDGAHPPLPSIGQAPRRAAGPGLMALAVAGHSDHGSNLFQVTAGVAQFAFTRADGGGAAATEKRPGVPAGCAHQFEGARAFLAAGVGPPDSPQLPLPTGAPRFHCLIAGCWLLAGFVRAMIARGPWAAGRSHRGQAGPGVGRAGDKFSR